MRLFHRTIEAVARAQESDGNAFEVVEEVVGWSRWLRVRREVEGLANLMPRVRITELLHEVNCVTGIASASRPRDCRPGKRPRRSRRRRT